MTNVWSEHPWGMQKNRDAPNRYIYAVSAICSPIDFVHTEKFELRISSCPYLLMAANPRVIIMFLTSIKIVSIRELDKISFKFDELFFKSAKMIDLFTMCI